MKGKGFYFPRIPEVKAADIGILQKDGQTKKDQLFDVKAQFESDTSQYLQKAAKKYGGCTFLLPPEKEGEECKIVKVDLEPPHSN
jgi:hypothetical protein